MCAVSRFPVGCDVERIHPVDLALARRAFSREENAYLEALPALERDEAFFRLWTLKESYMKCLGEGFSLPMNSFTLHPGEKKFGTYRLFEYAAPDGYRYAACGREEEWDFNFVSLTQEGAFHDP